MQRTPINPSSWSLNLGFDQAELVTGHQRMLVIGGQDAVDGDGQSQHPGDMAAQLDMALEHVEAILAAGDMTLANVVRLNVYATDIEELFKHWTRVQERFASADGHFATSVLGVPQLPARDLVVMLEATALD